MNGGDPLAGLKDIHLPPPVGWWPPAPGWWFLAFLALGILAVLINWLLHLVRQRRYRRAALRKLRDLERNSALEGHLRLIEIAELVRQVAVAGCGREAVAELAGDDWLTFLDRTGRTNLFSTGPGRVLGTDLYRAGSVAEPELLPLVAKWIGRHRPC